MAFVWWLTSQVMAHWQTYAAPKVAGRAAPSCVSLKMYKYGMGEGGWGGLLGDSPVLPNSSLLLYINTLYRFHLIINTHCTFGPPRQKTNKQTPNPETEGQTPWNSNSEWSTMAAFPILLLAGGMQMDALSTSPGNEDGRSWPGPDRTTPWADG